MTQTRITSEVSIEPSKDVSANRLAFGVGCFHFASLRKAPHANQKKYFDDLKNYLLEDKLVTNLSIEETDLTAVIFDDVTDDVTDDLADSEQMYPYIQQCIIMFEIHMSHRVQKEYMLPWHDVKLDEKFFVEIHYSTGMPVTYVWSSSRSSPSLAVSILWKHFKNSNPENEFIRFQMIGPSPFHCDFLVNRSESDEIDISLVENRGYDDVVIAVPKELSDDDLRALVRFRLSDELSIFYRITRDSYRAQRDFYRLSNQIENLIGMDSFRSRFKRFFTGDPTVYDLSIELEQTIIDNEQNIYLAKEQLSSQEKGFGELILRNHIENRMNNIRNLPIDRHLSIVSILRERHNNGRLNYTVLFAAVVGAITALIVDKF